MLLVLESGQNEGNDWIALALGLMLACSPVGEGLSFYFSHSHNYIMTEYPQTAN